ncbi:hypothetical protein Tco_1579485, partial [Tanacetum coccineum]
MTIVTPQPLDEDEEILVPNTVQGPVAFDGTPPIQMPQPME